MGERRTYKAVHLFAGIGGGALGFQRASAKNGGVEGQIETVVGIDVCPSACRDFEYITKAPAACIDLFTAEQYLAFHSKWKRVDGEWVATKQAKLPDGWTEATPRTIRDACRGIAPDIVFLSPPCKGLSALLSGKRAGSPKYQALNQLVVRGLWLLLEAFPEAPPRLILLENVPRIQVRGRELIDRNVALLNAYQYAVQETVHNCGEIGGLAQSRKRFLLVARHVPSTAPFLYEPPSKPMRPLGDEVLKLPLPFDPEAGPMHRLSTKMHFKTWLRLALIRAGKDWRDLQRWAPGSFSVERTPFNNVYRVLDASETAPAVTAGGTPTAGGISVADPRLTRDGFNRYVVQDTEEPARTVIGTVDVQSGAHSVVDPRMSLPDKCVTLRVRDTDQPSPTVAASSSVWDSGGFSTVDPRPGGEYRNGTLGMGDLEAPSATVIASADIWATGDNCTPDPRVTDGAWHNGALGVADPCDPAGAICAGSRPTSGRFSTVDPRPSADWNGGVLGVATGDEPAGAVCGRSTPTNGAFSVADPRPTSDWNEGVLGVVSGEKPLGAVCGKSGPTNGAFSLADQRTLAPLPDFWPAEVPVLLSPHDGMMHRPLTPLELAALQSFPTKVDGEPLKLDGNSTTKWRDKIGNAVPPDAAEAIGRQMLKTLLSHDTQTPAIGCGSVWVAPHEWYDRDAFARLGGLEACGRVE